MKKILFILAILGLLGGGGYLAYGQIRETREKNFITRMAILAKGEGRAMPESKWDFVKSLSWGQLSLLSEWVQAMFARDRDKVAALKERMRLEILPILERKQWSDFKKLLVGT